MKRNHWILPAAALTTALIAILIFAGSGIAQDFGLYRSLGQKLYFDTTLSEPDGQSCASCHEPTVGFDDPDSDLPVSEGVIPGLFGTRNAPISAYAMYAPAFHFDNVEGLYIGGQFWDGRATGGELGDPLADQAVGPFLNPVEMANADKEMVLADILDGPYAILFTRVCGRGDLQDQTYVDNAYDCVGVAIGMFERSNTFARFNSKYDFYLRRCLALGGLPQNCAEAVGPIAYQAADNLLTAQEWHGMRLFMGPNNNDGVLDPGEGAGCEGCHVADWVDPASYSLHVVVPFQSTNMIPPLFTDFSYDNLGAPKSDHPLLVGNPVDYGLGGVLSEAAENGKFKVMGLRNIGQSAPYLHHGLFDTLEEVVHFYNTRDVVAEGWAAPEVPETVNSDELGNLGLSTADEEAIAAFMRTLDDGWDGWLP
ncbi:MAG: cytochrome c peroxidase [Anaerolineae bacterium]